MGLTIKRIAHATMPGRYGDGHGLYLQILSPTNRSWLLRYQRDGRERWLGLGPLHTVGLAEARERARQARLKLLDGIDPIESKRIERATRALADAKALTFEAAARQYFFQHERKWKNRKHRAQFLNTMRDYVFPKIGRLSVASIDTGLVLKCLEPIWPTKTVTADRVRGRIEGVLDWATVRGYRTGDNPARWKGHLGEVLPAPSSIAKPIHHAALAYDELPEFMAALALREGVAARGLEFLVLTAARTGAVVGATWDEIDLGKKVWTVPPERMGAKISGEKTRRVPLSDRAIEILNALPTERGNPHVFIGSSSGAGLSDRAMASVLTRMGRDTITIHGFRSTFKDWVSETTNYANEVSEAALWHAVADQVEKAYRRGDLFEKRA